MPYSPVNTQASGMRFSPYRIGAKNIAKTTAKCHITHQEQKTDTQTAKGLWAERGKSTEDDKRLPAGRQSFVGIKDLQFIQS